MSWFIDWFDSPYYHILYKKRNEEEAIFFINNLFVYLKIKKESKIIDIACGKGRHATYFNKLGFEVVGIDLSSNSIQEAKKNENDKLKFFTHDMRKTFKKEEFDIATNLFTSFGYSNPEETISAISSNLKKKGLLVIDFMNVYQVIPNLIKSEKTTIDNINFNITRDCEGDYIVKKINFIDNKKEYKFQEKVRALNLTDFERIMRNNRMKIINIFGDYKLNPFEKNTSERLILICKK